MSPLPDERVPALFHRLADDDREALGELFDRAAPLLLPVALRITGDDAPAEAAVEQAFAELWRDRRPMAGRTPPGLVPLLARCRALALSRRAQAPLDARRAAVSPAADSEAAERVLDMSADERASIVGGALLGLAPAEQRVLERAYFEGSSISEIADDMGAEPGEVRRLLQSALSALRAAIDGDGSA